MYPPRSIPYGPREEEVDEGYHGDEFIKTWLKANVSKIGINKAGCSWDCVHYLQMEYFAGLALVLLHLALVEDGPVDGHYDEVHHHAKRIQ